MRRFKVVNKTMEYMDKFGIRKYDTSYITLHNPPYEDEDVLSHTKWKLKDCTITDVTPKFQGEE